MRYSSKPVGWRNESHRHYLAAKGISMKKYMATNESWDKYKERQMEFVKMQKEELIDGLFSAHEEGDEHKFNSLKEEYERRRANKRDKK